MLHSIYALLVSRRPKASDGERVCNRLERVRDEHGLSRQNLADAVGVHYQTIGYIERGEYSPSLELALRIGRLFDVPVEAVFTLEPVPAESRTAPSTSQPPTNRGSTSRDRSSE